MLLHDLFAHKDCFSLLVSVLPPGNLTLELSCPEIPFSKHTPHQKATSNGFVIWGAEHLHVDSFFPMTFPGLGVPIC